MSRYSHGSVCAAILQKHSPDAHIISIQMSRHKGTGCINVTTFYKAIELCLGLNIDIIHLSAGISDITYYNKFNSIINRLATKGILIVAASSEDETVTIPACYSNVIGVIYSSSCNQLLSSDSTLLCGADVVVKNTELLRKKDGGIDFFGGRSSYSVPFACSSLINNISQDRSLKIVNAKLSLGINFEKILIGSVIRIFVF